MELRIEKNKVAPFVSDLSELHTIRGNALANGIQLMKLIDAEFVDFFYSGSVR